MNNNQICVSCIATVAFVVLFSFNSCLADEGKPYIAPPYNYIPPNGVISDETTAIAVAEAILKPIYGGDKIKSEEPFTAVLKNDIWTVTGTFYCEHKYCLGGVAEIKISRTQGTIVHIEHGK